MDNIKPIEKTTGEALVIRSALHGMYERGNDSQCVMVMAEESVCFNFTLDLQQGLKFTLEQWNQIVEFVDSQLLGESDKQPSWGPDWSTVPGKYRYLACDADGHAYFYEFKPCIEDYAHMEWSYSGAALFAGYEIFPESIDWSKSLFARPTSL